MPRTSLVSNCSALCNFSHTTTSALPRSHVTMHFPHVSITVLEPKSFTQRLAQLNNQKKYVKSRDIRIFGSPKMCFLLCCVWLPHIVGFSTVRSVTTWRLKVSHNVWTVLTSFYGMQWQTSWIYHSFAEGTEISSTPTSVSGGMQILRKTFSLRCDPSIATFKITPLLFYPRWTFWNSEGPERLAFLAWSPLIRCFRSWGALVQIIPQLSHISPKYERFYIWLLSTLHIKSLCKASNLSATTWYNLLLQDTLTMCKSPFSVMEENESLYFSCKPSSLFLSKNPWD